MKAENINEKKVKKLIKALEKIGKKEIIYHNANGTKYIHENLYELILDYIQLREPDYTFTTGHTDTGHFLVDVYLVNNWVIVVSDWQNEPGWCYDERIVEVIKL